MRTTKSIQNEEFRVIITGGREYGWNKDTVTKKLTPNIEQQRHVFDTVERLKIAADQAGKELIIIHGAAKGADTLADEAANILGVKIKSYPVKPEDWNKYGKAAGMLRNKQMRDENDPHLVVAFSGGRGTANMCALAKENFIIVRKV